ncbi:MAG: hypothetical protein QW279_16035 [Candidatus Jordarchaeaceae archaeon]
MYPSLGHVGYPVAKIRLFMSIISAAFFGFLLYSASVNLRWFTIFRGFFLLSGIIEGVLIGELEARIVTRKLVKETETLAWQIPLISAVLCGLPLLLALMLSETSELLPFAAYLVLPFYPAYCATSGWCFRKFERQNKVQIFMFIYGIKFWTEPILSDTDRLNYFMDNVASKDALAILSQAGYSKRLMATLEEKQNIEKSTRKALSNILQVINEYRHRTMIVSVVFFTSCLLLIVYFIALASTNTFGLVQVVNNEIISGQVISLILACVPTFSVFGGVFIAAWRLRKQYSKRISSILESLDSNKLSSTFATDEK